MTDIVSCLPVWGRKRKKRGRKKTFFILSCIFVCLFLLLNMTGIVFLSAEETDGRWRLTPRGFLVSNQLIGDLLDRQEQASWEDLIRPRQDQA